MVLAAAVVQAARVGDVATVEAWLNAGGDANERCALSGKTLLHFIASDSLRSDGRNAGAATSRGCFWPEAPRSTPFAFNWRQTRLSCQRLYIIERNCASCFVRPARTRITKGSVILTNLLISHCGWLSRTRKLFACSSALALTHR